MSNLLANSSSKPLFPSLILTQLNDWRKEDIIQLVRVLIRSNKLYRVSELTLWPYTYRPHCSLLSMSITNSAMCPLNLMKRTSLRSRMRLGTLWKASLVNSCSKIACVLAGFADLRGLGTYFWKCLHTLHWFLLWGSKVRNDWLGCHLDKPPTQLAHSFGGYRLWSSTDTSAPLNIPFIWSAYSTASFAFL